MTEKTTISGMLTCRQVEQFLMDFLDGRVSLWTRLKFLFHLSLCDDCRQYLKDYKNAVALGRHIFTHPDDVADGIVPDAILEAILKSKTPSA